MIIRAVEENNARLQRRRDAAGLGHMLSVYLSHSNVVDTESYNQIKSGLNDLDFLLDTRGVSESTEILYGKLSKECMSLMCSVE